MRVLFLISGRKTPASRFRVLNYLPFLRKADIKCTVLASFPSKYTFYPWLGFRPSQLLKRMVRYFHYLIARVSQFDIVFLERELFDNETYDLDLKFFKVASKAVLDVDDGIFLRYPEKFKIIAERASMIIVGNTYLGTKAETYNENVKLLPTSVLIDKYPVKEHLNRESKPTIGWTGLDSNIPNLKLISNALNRLAQEFRFKLCVVSSTPERIEELALVDVEVQHVKWNSKTEFTDMSVFDIGVMPLVDDEWSRYKCGLKLIQYMALGIPAVVSPVGVNADIVAHGQNGFLASNAEEWYDSLKSLLESHGLRKKMGLQARSDAEDGYAVEANWRMMKMYFENLMGVAEQSVN